MKIVKTGLIVVAMMMFSLSLYAQDTVNVAPGKGTLYEAVNDAANLGKVFKLQRGGVYILDQIVEPSPDAPFVLIGEAGPKDTPPAVLQRLTEPGGAEWQRNIVAATDVTLENIAVVGYTPIDEQYRFTVRMTKSNTKLVINNCFFQNQWGHTFHLVADSVAVDFTNNICWGTTQPSNWQNGWLWQGGGVEPGLLNITNNTFFMQGSVIGYNGALIPQIIFDHNTVAYTNREWVYPDPVENAQYTNNIFYNAAMRGFVGPREAWGYSDGDFSDDADGDSLVGLINIDTLGTWIEGIDDNQREVIYSNNLRFTTQEVLDWQTGLTASYQPTMNEKTASMFEDFAGMVAENNIEESMDPEFANLPPSESILAPYFANTEGRRNEALRSENWPEDWAWDWDDSRTAILSWPPPIDLKPENMSVWEAGSDGYPLGDLNWFGEDVRMAWEDGLTSPVGVEKVEGQVPTNYSLEQNYPNPFNPTTIISYSIPAKSNVTLSVFNLLGQKVMTLFSGVQSAGSYNVDFNASKLTSGIYVYQIQAGNFTSSKKMMLIK